MIIWEVIIGTALDSFLNYRRPPRPNYRWLSAMEFEAKQPKHHKPIYCKDVEITYRDSERVWQPRQALRKQEGDLEIQYILIELSMKSLGCEYK